MVEFFGDALLLGTYGSLENQNLKRPNSKKGYFESLHPTSTIVINV